MIRGGPDHDRPKTAILGPQFCRILVLGPHFWWSGGPGPPLDPPLYSRDTQHQSGNKMVDFPTSTTFEIVLFIYRYLGDDNPKRKKQGPDVAIFLSFFKSLFVIFTE